MYIAEITGEARKKVTSYLLIIFLLLLFRLIALHETPATEREKEIRGAGNHVRYFLAIISCDGQHTITFEERDGVIKCNAKDGVIKRESRWISRHPIEQKCATVDGIHRADKGLFNTILLATSYVPELTGCVRHACYTERPIEIVRFSDASPFVGASQKKRKKKTGRA